MAEGKLDALVLCPEDKMNREAAFGLLLIGLLIGGVFLLGHRTGTQFSRHFTTATEHYVTSPSPGGPIRMVPMEAEPRRYKNKETRDIEYNEDGLPTKITITRDYAIT